MKAVNKALRNAALVATGFFGRFGSDGRPEKYDGTEVRGSHKFKPTNNPSDSDGSPDVKFEIKPLPENFSFRDWCNYWRQYRRRGFIFHQGGTYRRTPAKLRKGNKSACRFAKRAKVAAMQAAGHFKGDNRPVIVRQSAH